MSPPMLAHQGCGIPNGFDHERAACSMGCPHMQHETKEKQKAEACFSTFAIDDIS